MSTAEQIAQRRVRAQVMRDGLTQLADVHAVRLRRFCAAAADAARVIDGFAAAAAEASAR